MRLVSRRLLRSKGWWETAGHKESAKEETAPCYRCNLSAEFKVPGLHQISLNVGLWRHPNKYGNAASWKRRSLRIHPQNECHLAAWSLKCYGEEMWKAMVMWNIKKTRQFLLQNLKKKNGMVSSFCICYNQESLPSKCPFFPGLVLDGRLFGRYGAGCYAHTDAEHEALGRERPLVGVLTVFLTRSIKYGFWI